MSVCEAQVRGRTYLAVGRLLARCARRLAAQLAGCFEDIEVRSTMS